MIASENLDEKRPGATANMDSDQPAAPMPDMDLLEQKLIQALTLHQSGQLDDAADLYRDVLRELPAQPNANHNLGVILLEAKDFETSLELFKTALEAAPEDPQYWISYVEALMQAGQHDYAGEVLNHGIEGGLQGEEVDALKRKLDETKATPADVPVFASEQTSHKTTVKAKKNGKPSFDEMNRLVTAFNSGRLAESEQLASHMTQRYPRHGIGWKVLGAIRQQQGMMDEAFKAFKLAAEYLPNDSEAHYNLGNYYFDQGQLSAAAMCYQKAVRIEPGFAKAHYNLGSVQKDQKQFAAAEASYKKALKLSPANAQMHFNMGVVLNEQGQFAEAETYFRSAIGLDSRNAEFYYSLGGNLNAQGRLEDARACYLKTLECDAGFMEAYCCLSIIYQYFQQSELAEESLRKAIAIKPDFALAHFNLGNRLRDQYRLEEAISSYQNALQLTPENAEIYNNLGLTLKELDRLEAAEACYKKAIELAPDYSGAYNNLGVCLKELVRIPEAIASCRRAIELSPDSLNAMNNLGVMLYEEGSLTEAEAILKQALIVDPTFAKAYSNLGAVYDAQLKIDDAVKFMMQALAQDPNLVEGYNNLGRFHLHRENFAEAEKNLLQAIALKPDYYEAYSNLGSAHMMQGRLDRAVDWFRKALAIKPGYHQALSNLLFCITHNPVLDKHAIFAEHKTFGERFETPFKSHWPQLTNSKDKARGLKIGFVSGDFRNHPVAFFIEPVLEHLAQTPGLSLYAYSNSKSYDKVSERIEKHFSEWTSIIHLSDEAFAEKVREDGIDILMDLSGHTAGHRLLSFARKPAPIQASWIGCPSTTGLTAMDYYLADSYLLPPGQLDDQFTEKLVQLPASAPFMPAEYSPSINALPASTNKYFTFASFNRPSKLSQTVIALWARVLRAVPDSKMLLGAMQQDEGRAKILSWFEQEGVSADRLILRTRSDMHDYLKMHHEVDLCLDTFPYNGGTTTWHAIWMGVPTLTLAGDMLPSRIGAGILGHVGLDDFVVTSQDEFVEKGIYWTQHLDQLAQHRAHMRERFSRSAPGQPEVIANGLAAAFHTMWQRWCDDAPAVSFEVRLPEEGMGEAASAIRYAHEPDQAKPAVKTTVTQFEIVSATRLTEQQFWSECALGQSLKRLMQDSQALDSKITARIAFENTRGLPDVFNECIRQASDDAILIFMHDDVWIDEPDFMGAVLAGLEHFDVVGVAGNRRNLPNQPSWNFIDTQFTWDSGAYLSGHVGHGPNAGGRILKFGPIPNECELLDGIFLAISAYTLKQHAILFDPQFDFHFYDMDFCRSARQAGLKLGTWSIGLTHQSEGAFGSQSWRRKYARYLDKWDADTKHEVADFLRETDQKEQGLAQALGEVLHLALEHHQAGEIELAQKLYLEILHIQPRHAEANHKLGLIEAKLQGAEIAVPRLEIAVAEMPQNEQYWLSYIDALVQSGALESAAGAIELGQQFGLSQHTAQLLTAEISQLPSSNAATENIAIHVHQIYYSGDTQQQNDPGFEPLDNLANPRPDWREYWPMRQYLLNNALDENTYYGFLSPKFKEKTNLSAADVHAFITAHASEADVFLFSPYFDQGAFSLNMFEQGESQHTAIKAAFEGSVAKVAPQVDLATLVMDSRNIVFCNYIVAKPVFWRAWLAICEQLFAEAEENMTALAASLNAGTSHNNAEAPNKVFVIERMASLMLSTQPKNKQPVWRIKAYDSTLLPFSIAPISHYPRELRQLDELKIEGTPQSLARYANIRDSLQERIQRPFEQELQEAVKEVLGMAKAQQSQGDIEQAAQLYAEVIKIQPRHAEANYQLGVIEAHSKGVKLAVPRFELAVQAAPENEQYWVAYIDALVLAGNASSAISAIELGQQYGLKPETAEMLETEFAADLEAGLRQEKEQAIALQQSVLAALKLELKPSNRRPENIIDLANAEPVIYVWAPDYSEFSSGVKCLHLLCDRLRQLGYEAYVTAENTNKRLNAPTLTDELKQQHQAAGRLQIAIYPEVEAGNPIGVPNVVRYLLNQPNKFFKTSWFGKFHPDEQILHYDDSYTLPWVESQSVRIQTVNRDLFTVPADKAAERSGFLVYSHREKPDLNCIPDWCHPYQVISMEKPKLPEQLAALYQQSLGMIMFERSAASVEAMLCGCPIIYSSSRGLDRSTVFYHGYDDFDVAWDFDPAGFRQAQASVASFAAIYDGNVAADTQDLQIAISNIITSFRQHAPDVLETTPAYVLATARQSVQQDDIRTAILGYRQLLMDHPDCVEAYYRMAETLVKIGLAKPALQTLKQGEPYLAQLPQHACLDAVRDMYRQKLVELNLAI